MKFFKWKSYYNYIITTLLLWYNYVKKIFEHVQKVMNVQILCVHNIIIMNTIINQTRNTAHNLDTVWSHTTDDLLTKRVICPTMWGGLLARREALGPRPSVSSAGHDMQVLLAAPCVDSKRLFSVSSSSSLSPSLSMAVVSRLSLEKRTEQVDN